MKEFTIEKADFRSKYIASRVSTEDSFNDLHDYYELAFFKSANLLIFIEDSKYIINDGDLFLIKPNVIHHLFYNKTNNYARYVIHFKKNLIDRLLKELNLHNLLYDLESMTFRKVSIQIKQRNDFEYLFKALINETSDFTDQKLILNLVMLLIKYYEELGKNQHVKEPIKKYLQVMQVVKHIDANYYSSIDLDLLERQFTLNKYYLCHIFKDMTGFSINQYIQYRRVIESQKLLKQTDKDILEICFDCGFNSLQNFYKAFKKYTGVTPCKFRNYDVSIT